MTTDRPYRKRLPEEEALRRLDEGAGTQFDPDVVAVCKRVLARTSKGASATAGQPLKASRPSLKLTYGTPAAPSPLFHALGVLERPLAALMLSPRSEVRLHS